jgi:hypothetical protein
MIINQSVFIIRDFGKFSVGTPARPLRTHNNPSTVLGSTSTRDGQMNELEISVPTGVATKTSTYPIALRNSKS